jgi:hypothetical protein
MITRHLDGFGQPAGLRQDHLAAEIDHRGPPQRSGQSEPVMVGRRDEDLDLFLCSHAETSFLVSYNLPETPPAKKEMFAIASHAGPWYPQ